MECLNLSSIGEDRVYNDFDDMILEFKMISHDNIPDFSSEDSSQAKQEIDGDIILIQRAKVRREFTKDINIKCNVTEDRVNVNEIQKETMMDCSCRPHFSRVTIQLKEHGWEEIIKNKKLVSKLRDLGWND
ncbi:MAG: hypothetical protein ACFFCS_09730 [Candidatus Hodarchaeota archaeon]